MTIHTRFIPFGRHKGRTVNEAAGDDPQYLVWLLSRPFFQDGYPILHSQARRAVARQLNAEIADENRREYLWKEAGTGRVCCHTYGRSGCHCTLDDPDCCLDRGTCDCPPAARPVKEEMLTD